MVSGGPQIAVVTGVDGGGVVVHAVNRIRTNLSPIWPTTFQSLTRYSHGDNDKFQKTFNSLPVFTTHLSLDVFQRLLFNYTYTTTTLD